MSREFHDKLAALLHPASLLVLCATLSIERFDGALVALFIMQYTASFFHIAYANMYTGGFSLDSPNYWKWIEYAISATAGAVSVLLSGNRTNTAARLAVIIVLGILQQLLGWIIDHVVDENVYVLHDFRFDSSAAALMVFIASIFQLAEIFVINDVDPPQSLQTVYITGWSLFGFHCSLQLAHMNSVSNTPLARRYRDRAFVEAVYSCLGWTAKLSVFATELSYLVYDQGWLAAALSGGISLAAIVATFWWG